MIIDLKEVIRDFTYISNVYKYVEKYGRNGHQIGRKIGDMLELITLGKIYNDSELTKRLEIEPKLIGFTTAGHKVEFGFYELNSANVKDDKLFGSIECKKVGVEVTKNNKTRNKPLKLGKNQFLEYSLSRLEWVRDRFDYKIINNGVNNNKALIQIDTLSGEKIKSFEINPLEEFKIVLTEDFKLYIVEGNETLQDVVGEDIIRSCKKFEIVKIENEDVYINIYDTLTGPQTIEKAKQASLVAMDIRKKIDNRWGKDDIPEDDKKVISILVIGEFSHWEMKSRNVVTTCIDHNLIVPDAVLIKAFEEFEAEYGQNFINMISKNIYRNQNTTVKEVISRVLNYFEGKVFYDIDLNEFVDFGYENGKLIIKEA